MALPSVRSRLETAARGDQLRRSSTAVRRSGHSDALAAAAGAGRSRSARSKTATRSHRRSASLRSYWRYHPIDRHANRSDTPVGRTRSRILDLACMRVRDREQVAFDMWRAIHACCDYRRASSSSLWGSHSEQQALAPADQLGSDGHANTNLPRAAASAARKGGRVPKTEPPAERSVVMPY